MKTAERPKTKVKKHRLRKTLAVILCMIIVFNTGILAAVGNFVYLYVIEKNILSSDNASYSGAQEETQNWLTQNSKDLYITSKDGLKLHALLAQNSSQTNKYAVICHGYTSRASHMSRYAKNFFDLGFSVLAVDARAHGESEGTKRGMGYLERKDLLLWIDELIKINQNAQIVLYGVSMGAATVMMTAGEKELPKNVKCIIEDCGYTSVYDEIGSQIERYTHLPAFPIADAGSVVTKIRAGYSFREASCVEAVKRCNIPILFIHGSKDKFVPFSMLDELYSAANEPKQKLVIEGAGHANASTKDPELYWKTVLSFLREVGL
ncbi:MAG: alpha/beta hydrolase [Acutalibacteraceae bacterium]